MTKKTEPTESYLHKLEGDLVNAQERFNLAKSALYKVTATAKLGQPDFENARLACLTAVKDIEKFETEIFRVRRALGK